MISLKEFYISVGGNVDEVVSRLNGSEDMTKRFLKKFLNDESFSLLESSLKSNDVITAFRGAHSLKGVASTLGLQNLYSIDFVITESLRAGKLEEAKNIFPKLAEEYKNVCNKINELE